MAENVSTPMIKVAVKHIADDSVSVAHLHWQVQPENTSTFTVRLGRFVKLELDAAFPVRPYRIIVQDNAPPAAFASLQTYLGKALTRALFLSASDSGHPLGIRLNSQERLAIAKLELISPATPLPLKKACQAMVQERLRRPADQGKLGSGISDRSSSMLLPEA